MDNINELTDKALAEVKAEIGCARCNYDPDFDDHNTINDWITYITAYTTSAFNMRLSKEQQRQQLVKAAGLVIAALVAQDRNDGFPPRHYE